MSRSSWKQWFLQQFGFSQGAKIRPAVRRAMLFESLDQRITPAVNAFVCHDVLTITGDAADNTITVSRNAAGAILVNGGAVTITGGTPTVANTTKIQVFGQDGKDTIALNEANGALPAAVLSGGAGNDTLTGGSGADILYGQGGNDTLLGMGGTDFLFGGANNDTLTGGDANDQVFGQSGNDRLIWNPGDDTDLNEGGVGLDSIEVNGGNGTENFTITPNGTRVRFDRVDPAPFSLDIGTSEALFVNANGGDDHISASNGLATLIQLTLEGGTGNDTILGGDGDDRIVGGDGNDFVDGNRGNDIVFLGAGDDTFQWDPGDASDTVEGQDGNDRMIFNGANIDEKFDISANGGRVRFTRDIGTVVMDLNDLERIDTNALGGADLITINDLSGTDVTAINVDLASTIGGTAGDGSVDTVTVNGTAGADAMSIASNASGADVLGLSAKVSVLHAEQTDALLAKGLAGDDVIDASLLLATSLFFSADGGEGDDLIFGGEGADNLLGGAGDDVLIGGTGLDVLDGGDGDNIVIQD